MIAALAAAASVSAVGENCSAAEHKASLPLGVTLSDITLPSDAPAGTARRKFEEFGVVLVRGLQQAHASKISEAAHRAHDQSLAMLNAGKLSEVKNGDHVVGWVTPDQTLFIPAPEGHVRDKQAMVLGLDYFQDASMLAAASDSKTLDLLEEMLGWRDIELFGKGQLFYKEGIANAASPGGVSLAMMGANASGDLRHGASMAPGGNPKYLHQDSAYFMFAHDGAVASLSFAVDVSGALDNGPLYVVPGQPAERVTSYLHDSLFLISSFLTPLLPICRCPALTASATCRTSTRRRTSECLLTSGRSTMRCESMRAPVTWSSSTSTRCTARRPIARRARARCTSTDIWRPPTFRSTLPPTRGCASARERRTRRASETAGSRQRSAATWCAGGEHGARPAPNGGSMPRSTTD